MEKTNANGPKRRDDEASGTRSAASLTGAPAAPTVQPAKQLGDRLIIEADKAAGGGNP
jgi:hypothetical protein